MVYDDDKVAIQAIESRIEHLNVSEVHVASAHYGTANEGEGNNSIPPPNLFQCSDAGVTKDTLEHFYRSNTYKSIKVSTKRDEDDYSTKMIYVAPL